MKIWRNGALVEQDAAPIDPGPGNAHFEIIAIRDGKPRRLSAHFLRLRLGCQLLAIPLRLTEPELVAAITAAAAATAIVGGAARIVLAREPMTVTITATAAPEQDPVRLMISAGTRRNEQSPLSMVQRISGPNA